MTLPMDYVIGSECYLTCLKAEEKRMDSIPKKRQVDGYVCNHHTPGYSAWHRVSRYLYYLRLAVPAAMTKTKRQSHQSFAP